MARGVIPDLTTVADGPDLDAFADAQDRLRVALGVDAVFRVPVDPVWPEGTQLDPETNEPYDPTVVPTSGGGWTEVVLRVSPIQRHIKGLDDVDEGPSGVMNDETIALRINAADQPQVADATRVIVNLIEYGITAMRDDLDQYIISGQAL